MTLSNRGTFSRFSTFCTLLALVSLGTCLPSRAADVRVSDSYWDYNLPSQYRPPVSTWLVYDPLFYFSEDGDIKSDVIERIEFGSSEISLLVYKHKTFHSGKRLTADEVICTIRRFANLSSGMNPWIRKRGSHEISVSDISHTEFVNFYASTPVISLGDCENGSIPFGSDPGGTGPYEVYEMQPGISMKLKSRDDFRAKNHPRYVEILNPPSLETASHWLRARDVNIVIADGWQIVDQKFEHQLQRLLDTGSRSADIGYSKIVNPSSEIEYGEKSILDLVKPGGTEGSVNKDSYFAQHQTYYMLESNFDGIGEETFFLYEYMSSKDDDGCPKCPKSGSCPESIIQAAKQKECPCPKSGSCPE